MRNLFLIFAFVTTMFASNLLKAQTNQDLYFVFLNTNPDKPLISESEKETLQAAHMANIDKLAGEGILLAAGPFDGGGGMFVLHTEDIESAKALVQSDPAVKADRFLIEIYPFHIGGNDLCGAKEPYEMVTYQFVKISSNVEWFGDMDEMNFENRLFLSNLNNDTDDVIVYGSFGEYNDGMLILDVATPEEAENIFKEHPSVKAGQLLYEVKTLWIAKGTFCKK